MILIENAQIVGLEPAIRGMRNPMNSWERSDSQFSAIGGDDILDIMGNIIGIGELDNDCGANVGPNDFNLMLRLAKAGSVDGKFRRMIAVYVDLTAPLYWWKEFDTYKVGTVANSCSTMHKIHAKEFTLDDFSHEHLISFTTANLMSKDAKCSTVVPTGVYSMGSTTEKPGIPIMPKEVLSLTIEALNRCREAYLETKDKRYWWQMIQLLPPSYNQKRTVMLNYEVLSNIYQHRRNHKLDEWREVCRWIESLPYSEIITCNAVAKEESNAIMAAVAKLKNEQWSTEDIVALLLGQTKKEQLKSFADSGDTRPVRVHGGIFDVPNLTVGDTPKES